MSCPLVFLISLIVSTHPLHKKKDTTKSNLRTTLSLKKLVTLSGYKYIYPLKICQGLQGVSLKGHLYFWNTGGQVIRVKPILSAKTTGVESVPAIITDREQCCETISERLTADAYTYKWIK